MLKKNQFHLVPRKYHHLLEDVQEFAGVVEVLLKPGIEYDVGSSLACYERSEFCRADGTPSETVMKRCIAREISLTREVPLDYWHANH